MFQQTQLVYDSVSFMILYVSLYILAIIVPRVNLVLPLRIAVSLAGPSHGIAPLIGQRHVYRSTRVSHIFEPLYFVLQRDP